MTYMYADVMHCSVCRIQLKLPAGNTKVVEMNKADTLEALRVCVAKVYCICLDTVHVHTIL
jgi:hypothetical protein